MMAVSPQVLTPPIASAPPLPSQASSPASPDSKWITATVKKGQTLSTIFTQHGLSSRAWIPVVNAGADAHRLKRLKLGAKLKLKIANKQLQALRYPYAPGHTLNIKKTANGYSATVQVAELTKKRSVAHGTINSSLFLDGENAGLTDRQIMDFAHIFAYDVDFGTEIHAGDRFTVVYNKLYRNGKKVRNGQILAAEIQTNGHDYRAVYFANKNGSGAYYTPTGRSLHREFLRTPVSFTRISSGFSRARMNPVLHIVRPHWGTDFAAPRGTPIHATSNGRISYIGRDGGYGNCIKIHLGKYETIYGHMLRFAKGMHRGSHVKQGQVIGYVGMTGIATGPHVHYEIRVNGKPHNPMTIKLPNSPALPHRDLPAFKQDTAPLLAALNRANLRQYAANGPTIGTR